MSAYMEKSHKKENKVHYKDGITILDYLFHKKIKDKKMRCQLKKAKTRYFIKCKEGRLIKDNYWEVAIKKNRLKLLARSTAALYIVEHYQFRELTADKTKIGATLEKALVGFFNP